MSKIIQISGVSVEGHITALTQSGEVLIRHIGNGEWSALKSVRYPRVKETQARKMEKDLLLERQAIGIARAKAEGKYTGRKAPDPTVVKKAKDLVAFGMPKTDVAHHLKIGRATLYRYLKHRCT